MKKLIKKIVVSVLIFVFLFNFAFASDIEPSEVLKTVNKVAALNCLNKASDAYEKKQWSIALFQAQLGKVYDSTLADFPYIEALCYKALKYPLADQLERVEFASADGMKWRIYDKNNALMLCSTIYAKTKQYQKAFTIASELPFITADIDYIKAVSLYGLERWQEARQIISKSLDRWSFDSRFPKLFLIAEKNNIVSNMNHQLSMKILSRLYVWEKNDPSLFIFSIPFESSTKEIKRRLRIYREMYQPFTKSYSPKDLFTRSYALVLSLKYGVIDESTAVDEFFTMKSICKHPKTGKTIRVKAFYAEHLYEIVRSIGSTKMHSVIANKLATYSDCIFYDEEIDAVLNSVVFFKDGRPKFASFDNNQDGYSEYIVNCNFGIPEQIISEISQIKVKYDNYPSVNSIQTSDQLYVMRPLDLEWSPIKMKTIFLDELSSSKAYANFFTLALKTNITNLSKNELVYSASYVENSNSLHIGGTDRVYFDRGIPISSETKINGKTYSSSNFQNGFIALKNVDRDIDGYFETKEVYSKFGKLESILLDLNKNNLYEYIEKYDDNGTVRKIWDSNEDSQWEILYTEYPDGTAQAEWIHPKTNKIVAVNYVSKIPKSVKYMDNTKNIIQEGESALFWVEKVPAKHEIIAKKITKVFNQLSLPVVSYNMRINGLSIFATRSGGFIFADILED